MIYVTSDIHGRLDRLKKLIKVINLSSGDKLYIIGDLVDRGYAPIETIEFVMSHPLIDVIMGNHDEMMLYALKYNDEVQFERWTRNGYEPTLEGFKKRTIKEQNNILSYLDKLPYFKFIEDKYLLVHAGFEPNRLFEDIKNMSIDKALENQRHKLVWVREDFYLNKALEGIVTIFRHTPVNEIEKSLGIEEKSIKKIWVDNIYKDKIGIDTGNCYDGGRLACLRLDDSKVYYIDDEI